MKASVRVPGFMSLLCCVFVSTQLLANTPDVYLTQSQQEDLERGSILQDLSMLRDNQAAEAAIESELFSGEFISETLSTEPVSNTTRDLDQGAVRVMVTSPAKQFDELAAYESIIEETHRSRRKTASIKSGLPHSLQGFIGNACAGASNNQRLLACHLRELRSQALMVQGSGDSNSNGKLVVSVLQNYHSIRQGYVRRKSSNVKNPCYLFYSSSTSFFATPGLQEISHAILNSILQSLSKSSALSLEACACNCYVPREKQ